MIYICCRYDRKLEAEIANYNPWGRGGAGAPMTDSSGKPIGKYKCLVGMAMSTDFSTWVHGKINDQVLGYSLDDTEIKNRLFRLI